MNVPKYYYNLNRCISDGKTQFDTSNMPKETYEVNGQIYSGSNELMDLLNNLHEEKESWKHQCISADNQNSMLWNEISYMREQGAKPSDAFEKYLDEISSDYDRFWRRKLKKAKELEGIVND